MTTNCFSSCNVDASGVTFFPPNYCPEGPGIFLSLAAKRRMGRTPANLRRRRFAGLVHSEMICCDENSQGLER